MIYCAGAVGAGDGGGVVGDASWLLSFRVTSLAGVVWVVLWVLGSLVMPTVRVLQVMLWWMAFLVVVRW